ncbi:MAG: helix-hairpin-helix domain-containing protein [Chlorobium sp.]|uniref:ComEA family DNA-binding protein n=1 Tax=Chlorobium sp. TaxID=1095 RepID=UPI0025BF1F09|nr:helix-hairpin-helix domain-containing protein [Chlorobium sp.]MCF8216460.1 helix-hairpin-helix domain-containing protein [Chlorobium sp.]MCF8271374.1 helix-hairpin-helix domain-containing protein [Chlorobium sp.]MCF8287737.1 helix-hairpin-helix domain-containing protein [Chlorobium sp.]MCF8291285.1 helix-hairpin-helix domain-containing protein [Chlorobium sp.]MCF8385380.1 helix-hairpin-helix domain-containing protein [Chlorobium sp.]
MAGFIFLVKRLSVFRVMALSPLFFIVSAANSPLHAESLQELFDQERLSGNIEQLQERLDELEIRKIRINDADPEALRELPWLNSGDVLAITDYRRTKGPFASLSQLQEVIGPEKARAIIPYITFLGVKEREPAKKKAFVTGSYAGRILWDTTPRNGLFPTANNPVPRYAGDEYKLYNRLKLDYANYGVSLVHDKDIGEPDAADFLSLSVSASDLGIVKTAVLGNYEINAGQGLLIGQSRFLSKGSEPSNSVMLSSKRLSSYGSSSEYGFFQGIGITFDFDPLEVTAFYSANKVDARNSKGPITSFDESGYHRTMTERSRKDNVTETVYGASLLYRFNSGPITGKAGGTWLRYHYGEPLEVLDYGQEASSLGSVEAGVSIGRLGIFGEAAWSEKPDGCISWIAGAEYRLFSKVNLLLAVRDYAEGYYSPFAGAFAERGDGGSNEQGVYFGFDAKISSKFTVGAYYDWFRFPKLDPDPMVYPYSSSGYDTRLFVSWKQSSAVTWNLQVQHKEKDDVLKQCPDGALDCKAREKVYAPLPKVTDRIRLDCDINASRRIHLRTRGEVKRVVKDFLAGDESFYGWLVYQQAGYKFGRFGLKGRLTMFNTDNYDAAVYVYEDDLPLTFNTTGFSGRGKAFFVLASWDVSKNLKLAGKFETAWYEDRDVYSSGADQRNTSAPGTFHFGCFLKF